MTNSEPGFNPPKLEQNDNVARVKVYQNFLSADECDQLIGYSEEQGLWNSAIGGKKPAYDLYIRNSEERQIGNTSEHAWLFDRMQDVINQVNQDYKFILSHGNPFRILKYKVGGHYNRHEDLGVGPTSTRKISLAIQLSNPEDYDGGDLEFTYEASKEAQENRRNRGAAIIFPSFLAHKVTIVTRGVRWSMVSWVQGPPFR